MRDPRMKSGDWLTIADMVGCHSEAAKKRFDRGDETVKEAIETLLTSRKTMIQEFQQNA